MNLVVIRKSIVEILEDRHFNEVVRPERRKQKILRMTDGDVLFFATPSQRKEKQKKKTK